MSKPTNLRATLAGTTVELTVSRGSGLVSDILSGDLSIYTGTGNDRSLYLRIEGQANDWMARPKQIGDHAHDRTWWNLYRCSGFYAAHVATETAFRGAPTMANRDPIRAARVLKLLLDTIETYNLRYVYPDCELSQIAAALDRLGAHVRDHVDWIEGMDSHTWNRERINRDQEHDRETQQHAG